MVTLGELFAIFFRIGALGFGGPFALLSVIQKEVVEKQGWMTQAEYAESMGIGSLTPGPISSATVAFVGYRLRGIAGAAVAYGAFHIPSLILYVILAAFLTQATAIAGVRGFLKAVEAAVVGLLGGVALNMGRSLAVDTRSVLIIAISFVAVTFLHINPIPLMIGSVVVGALVLRGNSAQRWG